MYLFLGLVLDLTKIDSRSEDVDSKIYTSEAILSLYIVERVESSLTVSLPAYLPAFLPACVRF